MAQAGKDTEQTRTLSERIENHRREVQYLVKQGGEQPQYEFKRTISLRRECLEDRLDFIKLIQAVANADIAGERCIVIGADPKEKKFYPVTNAADFDSANVSKILSTYLDPLPRFQVCNLTTDESDPFVLILLDANQPRPIIVIKAGHTEKGHTRLEVGDAWIKRNTDTVHATRGDFDLMYKVKTEEEAEDRARKRLKHLLELTGAPEASRLTATLAPTFALLVGPKDELRKYFGELIATNDLRRFHMLLELAREVLVEGWDQFTGDVFGQPESMKELASNLNDFYQTQFIPAFESVVELGLLVIKHNVGREWMSAVIDLLVESFETSRSLTRLPISGGFQTKSSTLSWWKPGFEIYMGVRAIAIHTVTRDRLKFLETILPRIVAAISPDGSPACEDRGNDLLSATLPYGVRCPA